MSGQLPQLYELARSVDRTEMRVVAVEKETSTHGARISAIESMVLRARSYALAAVVVLLSLVNLGRDATIDILSALLKAAGK